MAGECVVDTSVLQKANAPITSPTRERSKFARRIALLADIQAGRKTALYSRKLLAEYERKVAIPRNDFVRAFFEILAAPGRAIPNWPRWSGSTRAKARKCRYPHEDDHVLRTAVRPSGATIFSEEGRMLAADACIHRELGIHILDPTAT
jgi:hypothetical protein